MEILKILSVMMDYPRLELQTHNHELEEEINSSQELPFSQKEGLIKLLHYFRDNDLMDIQEDYDSLFERGRATSLLLFEHVHGESRDRGQAMVDLMALYEDAGYQITVKELPDFIPLYLEFLSTRPELEAKEGIDDVVHIIGILAERLKQRESIYHHCFDALLQVADMKVNSQHIETLVSKEERDDSLQAMDKIWEEEMVTFTADDPSTNCKTTQGLTAGKQAETASPVHWVDTKTNATKQTQR
jgi:nitrate reductase delta subunit